MIKDLLISFKDNIKARSNNPFLGTLVLVWLTKNWNLVYSILNFDDQTTLAEKREFIIAHFTARPFLSTLLLCVAESILIIVVSYFLINFTRLIINFYEKRLTPWVYKWTDEKSIVLKSSYDALEEKYKRLEKRVDEERDAKLRLQEEYDKLEKRYGELVTKSTPVVQINTSSEKSQKPIKVNSKVKDKVDLLFDKLKAGDEVVNFKLIASEIKNGVLFEDTDEMKRLVTLGLVQRGLSSKGKRHYTLTQEGLKLHERIIIEELQSKQESPTQE